MDVSNIAWTVLRFAFALLLAIPAHAEMFRAYLAPTGSDANPCTLAQPCRLLPAALNAVANGGEIWMLDSANYNTATVNVTKSVSILAVPGAVGSVLAMGGPALSIATTGVSVKVRNLVIAGFIDGTGTSGIVANGPSSSLTVEDSLFTGLPVHGILVDGYVDVRVANTVMREIGQDGISAHNGSTVVVSGSRFYVFGHAAVVAYGENPGFTTTVIATDTLASRGDMGFAALSVNSTAYARLYATRCTSTNNNYGFVAETAYTSAFTATLTLSYSMATNNGTVGLAQYGTGTVKSTGNNAVHDNLSDTQGLITPISFH